MKALTIGLFRSFETHAPRWRSLGQAALISGVLMMGILPCRAQPQSTKSAFQDNYADVNSVRLHYASVGQGAPHPFPAWLPVILVPVERPDARNEPRSSGRGPRYAGI